MAQLRVCLICPDFPPMRSGLADYTALLATHLQEHGIAATVIASRGTEIPRLAGGGVRVEPIVATWGWPALPRLAACALYGGFDVVHVQYQNEMYRRSASICALPALLRVLRPRLPVLVTVHDYGTPWPRHLRLRAIAGPYGKVWFAAMLCAARRVVLVSNLEMARFTRQALRYPVPATRYRLIPVGSNLPPATAQVAFRRDGRLRVGYFGFVNPTKGVDLIPEAVTRARERIPELELRMICELSPANAFQARVLAALNDQGEAVVVTGDLPAAAAAAEIAACDLMLLPFRDGASLKRTTLMAALAQGRPVITTYPPGPAADMGAEAGMGAGADVGAEAGMVLVPAGDAAALADAIVALAADPQRRAELAEAARRAARRFSWPRIAAEHAKQYREVLQR